MYYILSLSSYFMPWYWVLYLCHIGDHYIFRRHCIITVASSLSYYGTCTFRLFFIVMISLFQKSIKILEVSGIDVNLRGLRLPTCKLCQIHIQGIILLIGTYLHLHGLSVYSIHSSWGLFVARSADMKNVFYHVLLHSFGTSLYDIHRQAAKILSP